MVSNYSPENIISGKVFPQIKSVERRNILGEKFDKAEYLLVTESEIQSDGLLLFLRRILSERVSEFPSEFRCGRFSTSIMESLQNVGSAMLRELMKIVRIDRSGQIWLKKETTVGYFVFSQSPSNRYCRRRIFRIRYSYAACQ